MTSLGQCKHCGGVPRWKLSGLCWTICPECWFAYEQMELPIPEGVYLQRGGDAETHPGPTETEQTPKAAHKEGPWQALARVYEVQTRDEKAGTSLEASDNGDLRVSG